MPLRVTIELIPRGDEARTRKIAVVNIENDGTGTQERGNYIVRAEGQTLGGWDEFARERVTNVPRADYLYAVLECLKVLKP